MNRPILVALLVACAACAPHETNQSSPAPTATSPRTEAPTTPPSVAAAEAAGCPVTLPASAWIPDLARFTPLPASRFTWYGDTTTLAVDLPIDGVYRIQAGEPTLGAKIAWWRYQRGDLSITARRLDGTAEVRTTNTAGYGDIGFNPSGVEFTSEGCWRITGSLPAHELTFVMFVRRVPAGTANP